MGFFEELSGWIDRLLSSYVSDTTARIAFLMEPVVVTLAVLYTIVWGYLLLTAKTDEPFVAGIKRILTLVIIVGVATRLWLYNEVIVDTFFQVPAELAARVVGAFDSVTIVDQILFAGDDAATLLMRRGGIFDGNVAYYLAGFAVYVIVGVTALYTIFLLILSRIALSVLLAIGPLFIALLFFETTKRFFESWIAQLANYAIITILTVLVAALMMRLVTVATTDAVRAGGSIEISHALRVCISAGLTLLVMRQVMPMAAGLASGLALSTFGAVSAAMRWGFGGAARNLGQFSRGVTDKQTTRWDSLSRKAGYYVGRGVAGGARAVSRNWRENSIRMRA